MGLGLLRVNVLIKSENSSVWTLYFYKPFTRNCNSFDIIEIGSFSPANYSKDLDVPLKNIFPPKLFKFHNCPLFISSFPFEPFIIIENELNGTITHDGIDVIIVNEISKTLNLVPIYVQPTDGENRGSIYPNGTTTGAIKMV